MKVDMVSIIIKTIDEDNASVTLQLDPKPQEGDEIEDSPAMMLGYTVWNALQNTLEETNGINVEGLTLQ